jgi:hypothetical protein
VQFVVVNTRLAGGLPRLGILRLYVWGGLAGHLRFDTLGKGLVRSTSLPGMAMRAT